MDARLYGYVYSNLVDATFDIPFSSGLSEVRAGSRCMSDGIISPPIQPDKPPSAFWASVAKRFRAAWTFLEVVSTKGGIWLMSVMATIFAPCLPLVIELFKSGTVKTDNIYITASVMSAAFWVSGEHVLFRALYLLLFVFNLILHMVADGPFASELNNWAWKLLGLVAVLHATERIWWHLILNRPFPEMTSNGG
jgi:hypothetical protein